MKRKPVPHFVFFFFQTKFDRIEIENHVMMQVSLSFKSLTRGKESYNNSNVFCSLLKVYKEQQKLSSPQNNVSFF